MLSRMAISGNATMSNPTKLLDAKTVKICSNCGALVSAASVPRHRQFHMDLANLARHVADLQGQG